MYNVRAAASRLLMIASAFIFTYCGDDDKPSAQFSYAIDGTSEPIENVSASLQSEIQAGHEGRLLNISFAKAGVFNMLTIVVSNWDFQDPPHNGVLSGKYDAAWDYKNTGEENPSASCFSLENGLTLCDGGLVTLYTENDVYSSVFDGNTAATITISKCDVSSNTVSGTFNAKVGPLNGPHLHTVNGSFENVKYTIR